MESYHSEKEYGRMLARNNIEASFLIDAFYDNFPFAPKNWSV